MIYEVYLDGECLYYPDDLDCVITNAVLTQELNDSGIFEFDVPSTNPLYGSIQNRKSMVQVLKDGEEIFYGEVRESDEVIDFEKHVCAIGELSFLFDSIQPQMRYQNFSPLQFFTTLLQIHNSQVEEKKQFRLGVVTVTDNNDSIYRYTNYEDTLTAMREKLCNSSLEGYLRIRKENGIRYLDLVRLVDYGKTCTQPIQFGKNLLDYVASSSGTSIATAVLPLGARLEQSTVEGLDAYTTIESVNDGVDYVYSPEAVAEFGWVKVTQKWNDVTSPDILKQRAEEWLKSTQFETLSIEVNAIDLSMLNSSIDSFDLGDSVQALAEPFGMDTWFPVRKKTTYLQDLSNNHIVLSNTARKGYTQQVASQVGKIEQEIPQQMSLLEAARQNASKLIQTATNGNIFLVYDEEGKPKELLIMDTNDINTAKKVWRWNINGLGYSSTGYNGEYGLAMTMDGHFVADAITVDGLEVGKNVKMGADATIAWENVLCEGNMLQNTDAFSDSTLWWGNHIKLGVTTDPNGGNEAYSFQSNTEGNGYLIQSNVFQKSGEYVLSFWAKASYDCDIYVGGKSFRAALVSLTTEWQKFTVSFECTITDPEWFCFGSYGTWTETDVIISLYHPMLETGSIASEWTSSAYMPSEDYATKITKNTITAEYINALEIKAGSVDAENITGESITGKKIVGGSFEFEDIDTKVNINNGGLYMRKKTGLDNANPLISITNEYHGVTVQMDSMGFEVVTLDGDTGWIIINVDGINKQTSFRYPVYMYGNLSVSGTKSRVATTENYNNRLLYCYEMPTPYFGDIGEGQLDESGICYVYIDDIFLETIDTGCKYQVFLQKYGEGEIVVSERNGNYFVVTGTPGLSFAWEVKAKQAGYTMERLDEFTQLTEEETVNYEAEATAYLSEYERSILNYA